jgi:hypothetical protein
MVFYKGAPTKATAELGYLRKLSSMGDASIGYGWKLAWKKGIIAEFQNAANVMNNSTYNSITKKKSHASSLYQRRELAYYPSDLLESYLYMLNPTPPAMRVPLSKLGDTVPDTPGRSSEEEEEEEVHPEPPTPTMDSTKKRPNGKQHGTRGITQKGKRAKNCNQKETRASTHKRGNRRA